MPLAPFEHLVALLDDSETPLEARVLASAYGAPAQRVALPFTREQLPAVLRLIECTPTPDELVRDADVYRALGWLHEGRLALSRSELVRQIGQRLYEALFPPGPVRTALTMGLGRARQERSYLPLQLHLDADAGLLACLPWELIHDEQGYLVQSGRLALARHIDLPAPVSRSSVSGTLRVLVVVSRPADLPTLDRHAEAEALQKSLAALNESDGLQVNLLLQATWRGFVEAMSSASYHIVHFDGHGDFGRRCPRCRQLTPVPRVACIGCSADLSGIAPQGHLAFERPDGASDWRSPENLAAALFRSPELRLAFLSACRSAVIGSDAVYAGIAPALISLGVPAVVAMQAQVPLYATIAFAEAFYAALAARHTLLDAAGAARAQLDEETWYRPTLYLRSRGDPQGKLLGS